MAFSNFIHKLKQYLNSRKGNFALLTAVLSPVVIVAGCLAVDIANLTDLKARLQAAMDSVSLSVATRISRGELTPLEAEEFGSGLLRAQMYDDYARFTQLVVIPKVKVTESNSNIGKSWDVQVYGSASQGTTPFAKFWGKDTMTVNMSSTATAFIEGQGALSMAIVLDVSGSMLDRLNNGTDLIKRALGLKSRERAKDILRKLDKAVHGDIFSNARHVNKHKGNKKHRLTQQNIEYILKNYSPTDCEIFKRGINHYKKNIFLKGIGKNPKYVSHSSAYKYCDLSTSAAKLIPEHLTRSIPYDRKDPYGRRKKGKVLAKHIDLIMATINDTKINALKNAAGALLTQFDQADPEKEYVRTGLVSYSHKITGKTKMEWGTSSAKRYITNMEADGKTSSTKAFEWAFKQIVTKNPTEYKEHEEKYLENLTKKKQAFRQQPKRAILFMTDGSNNNPGDDDKTRALCKAAKNDQIVIYTVAFDAPHNGRELLKKCASDDIKHHYFEAETAAELNAAFANIGRSLSDLGTRLIR